MICSKINNLAKTVSLKSQFIYEWNFGHTAQHDVPAAVKTNPAYEANSRPTRIFTPQLCRLIGKYRQEQVWFDHVRV